MLASLLNPLLGAYTTRSAPLNQTGGELWSYRKTAAGITVTEETAMSIAAVFNAITILSDAAKTLPILVYARKDAGREAIPGEPAYRLLHESPNGEMSPGRFKKLMVQWALQWGSGAAEIERNMAGQPINLWPIHPTRRYKDRDKAGKIVHKVRGMDGLSTVLPDDDVFEVLGYTRDGVNGISIVGMARESLGLTVAADEYGAKFFAKDAAPNVTITHPSKLTADGARRLRESWNALYGKDGTGEGVAILEEGMKVDRFGLPNNDAQFLETRAFQVVEIARWFNLPPHKLKDLSRSTFSNIEHQSIEYVGDSLMPWLVDFEEECDRKLLKQSERPGKFCEFLVDAVLRADSKSRAEALQIQRQNGVISANEWRAKENLNSVGDKGDVLIVPANFQALTDSLGKEVVQPEQVQQPDATPEPQPAEPNMKAIAEAHAVCISDALERMRSIELKECDRNRKRAEYYDWATGFYAAHVPRLIQAIGPAMKGLAVSVRAAIGGEDLEQRSFEMTREAASAIAGGMLEWFKTYPGNLKPIEEYDPQAEGLALANDFIESVTISNGAA